MRTDLNIAQYPVPTPDFGGLLGKGKTRTDPTFGSRITRLTDASVCNNRSMQTSDGAQSLIWNKDDTLIMVRSTGAKIILFHFDPWTMISEQLDLQIPGSALAFSRVSAHTIFSLVGTTIAKTILKMDTATNKLVVGSTTTIADFTKQLPVGFNAIWHGMFVQSEGDLSFTVGFSDGVQNTSIYVCTFQTWVHGGGKGYRTLNTQTGIVTGDWGALGSINLKSNAVTVPFTMHESCGTANPKYALLSPTGHNSKLVWEIATLNLVDTETTGHDAHGMVGTYSGGMGGGQLQFAPYSDPQKHTALYPASALPASAGQHFQVDSHYEFGPVNNQDASVIWASCGGQFGAVTPFTAAWVNEIRGYDLVAKTVLRACHTFNSCTSPEFITLNAIAVPSQTGRFVAFTSDNMKTLGATDGTADGTAAGKVARGDVFIVAIV